MTTAPASREKALLGLGLVAAGAVSFVLLLGRAGLEPVNLGRMLVILGLCYVATRGRHWASVLLALLALLGGLSLALGALRIGFASFWGWAYLAGAALYLGGYAIFWRAGGSSAFAEPRTG